MKLVQEWIVDSTAAASVRRATTTVELKPAGNVTLYGPGLEPNSDRGFALHQPTNTTHQRTPSRKGPSL
jgi:hypothetical protein